MNHVALLWSNGSVWESPPGVEEGPGILALLSLYLFFLASYHLHQSRDLLPFHCHPEHLLINLKDCSRLLGSSENSVSTSSFSHKHLISEHYILKAIHIFLPLLILSSFLFICTCLQSVRLRIWYSSWLERSANILRRVSGVFWGQEMKSRLPKHKKMAIILNIIIRWS